MQACGKHKALTKLSAVIALLVSLTVAASLLFASFAHADEFENSEETWNKLKTCEWRFDEISKTLVIRPYQNADSGCIENLIDPPWREHSGSIEAMEFQGSISLAGKCESLFACETNLREIRGLDRLDTSRATSFKNLFYNCSSLESLDIANWDTSNVTSLLGAFHKCTSLRSLDLSGWDTSNVETMNTAFENCISLETLNLDGWDTSNVRDMFYMFSNCRSLTSLDVTHFSFSSRPNIQHMFEYCASLESIDFSNCNMTFNNNNYLGTINYYLNGLFEGCISLKYVDLSGMTVPLDSASALFKGCSSLSSVRIGPDFNGRMFFPTGYWAAEDGALYEEFDIPQNTTGVYTYMGTVKEIIFPQQTMTIELTGGRCELPVTFVSHGLQEADVAFESSNPEVATIDTSGVVRPYKTGKTTITVLADRVSAKCDVVVVDTPKSPESPVDPVPEVPDIGPEDNTVPEQSVEPIASVTPSEPSTPSISLKGVSIKKLIKLHKGFKVKWSKPSPKYLKQIIGYKIRYSTSKSMKKSKTKTVKASSSNGKKLALKITKLKSNKRYYVQVATYKKAYGKIYCSKWSKVKKVKTK